MKQFVSFLILVVFVYTTKSNAQQKTAATSIGQASSLKVVPSLASRSNLKLAPNKTGEAKDKKSGKNISVYGKGLPNGKDEIIPNPDYSQKLQGRAPSLVFDAATSDSSPTDPAGAVGPNHYIVVFNTGYRIFNKQGIPLTAQLDTSTIFPNDGCCDLTVSYDTQAERFVMSYLGSGVQVAVSQTSDPIADGWFVYNFPMNTDYQKLSIWSDGYYLTANKDSGSAATSQVVHALERTKMLVGDPLAKIIGFPLPGIVTSGFFSPQAFNVCSSNFPAAGNVPIVYMQDDAWSGVTEDHVKLWTVNVDWVTPANSTISSPETLVTTPFTSVFDNGSFSNLSQPDGGAEIDALQATIMNQAQFRKFGTHNSALFNFVINTQTDANELAGIRWYELRQTADGEPWTIYQEGTYTAPDGKHAWHASMAMDNQGNIGMGYSSMSGINNKLLSSNYTGRYVNDPLGTMTIEENLIAQSSQKIPNFRYGDYSALAIDPVNDKTFWFINEYMKSSRKDVVGVFQIAPNFNIDSGVTTIIEPVSGTLSNAETIKIKIFNYGLDPASNFPVTYQVDGGSIVTETFSGTIPSAGYADYTFTTPANLSIVGQVYTLTAKSNLSSDQDVANDQAVKQVTYLFPNDVGVSEIIAPISSPNLTASEAIIVKITNFGGEPQSNFDVNYILDGNSVTENFIGPLAANSSVNYTFLQTGNITTLGTHTLSSTTNLPTDSILSNNSKNSTIIKTNCQPSINCNEGDGFRRFALGTINNISGCGTNGYNDFTSQSTNLNQNSTNNITFSTVFGNQYISVWIDFNDDFVFSPNEIILGNYVVGAGSGTGNYTQSTTVNIPATAAIGDHLLRAKCNWDGPVPINACENTNYGETEDYTVSILQANLSKSNFAFSDSNMIISSKNNEIFDVTLETNLDEKFTISVYTPLGQRVVFHKLKNKEGKYNYELDMSYAPSGVYLVKIGNEKYGKVKRIVVK